MIKIKSAIQITFIISLLLIALIMYPVFFVITAIPATIATITMIMDYLINNIRKKG